METEKIQKGHYHPLTLITRDFHNIFREMGFAVVQGPELDTEHYNFNMLNVPSDHPARDMQDTFWLKPEGLARFDAQSASNLGIKNGERQAPQLLRTQTSNMQIRYMETHEPPFRVISPGRVFRNEATDARHEAVFHQIEGLAIGKDITIGHLKGTLEYALGKLFGKETPIRFRPGFFPFVEPGFEIDAHCFSCGGSNPSCPLCKGVGWIEVVPGGMVHPAVLRNVGVDPEEWQGFAFGAGIERLAMVKYGIDDTRAFNNGDLRVVNQF